jgi:hypothetical protein
MTNYAKKHPYLLTTIIILILASILLTLGFRVQPNLSVSKNGTVEIVLSFASTTVYVDTQKIATTEKENETITKSLSVKTHTVIVGKPGYLPWTKDVTIEPNTTVVLEPIFVTQNATGQIITKNDTDYWTLRNSIQKSVLPTEAAPKISDGVMLWLSGNTVYIKEGDTVKTIITPLDTIRSLDFYAHRNDVIIFASDSGIYALDAIEDAAKHKANFLPVYKGATPIFLKTDPSFIYVLDGENLLQVVI